MTLGIVGSEGAKFTPETKELALAAIRAVIAEFNPSRVVSGACHLGGIDVWAIREADLLGIETAEYPPRMRAWEGYKARNLQIAEASDAVVCITLDKLPDTFEGMRHALCYHCGKSDHVKSGGCWTVKQARRMGKFGKVVVLTTAATR